MNETLPYWALAVSVLICLTGVYVAWRAGKWRDSDEARALHQRVERTERRLDQHELKLKDLPTKADFEALRGEVRSVESGVRAELRGVEKQLDGVDQGIQRVEGFLMERDRVA